MRSAARKTDAELARDWVLAAREDPVEVVVRQALRHRALKGEPTLAEDPARSWELDQFQADVINALADVWRQKTVINHDRLPWISVVSCHGTGKTHTAALAAHVFNACWPGRVIVTAPKHDQVRTRMFAAIQKVDLRAEAWYRHTHTIMDTEAYWYTAEGGRDRSYCILGETATKPENLAGNHETYQLVIVEEATGVPEALYPVIFGALSTGVIQVLLMISNGTQRTGTFADSHLKPREAAKYFRLQIGYERSARVSKKWAQNLIDKYGYDSPVVLVRVRGLFATEEPNQLIALAWINRARFADASPDGSIPRKKISVDCAGGGTCDNTITLGEHYQSKVVLRKQRAFNFPMETTVDQTADQAEKMWRDYGLSITNGDVFIVDVIGVGLGVGGELAKRGYPVVFHQGGAGCENKLYRNQRTQAYFSCRNAHRDGQLVYVEDFFDDPADWEDLEAQLTAIRTKDTNDRVEDLETKQELVTRLGFSPDRSDSISMQWSSVPPTVLPGAQAGAGQGEQAFVIESTMMGGLVRG